MFHLEQRGAVRISAEHLKEECIFKRGCTFRNRTVDYDVLVTDVALFHKLGLGQLFVEYFHGTLLQRSLALSVH